MSNQTFILFTYGEMGTYVEIDGKLYVTKEDYLNMVKYYENSLSAERNGAKEEIEELEEENKKLKEDNRFLTKISKEYMEKENIIEITEFTELYRDNLEEENKKLNEKVEHLEFDIEAWKKLKSVWEKKEQKLQIEIGGLMGERDGLQMVVERLHKELEECECSFGFESDEVGFWKREYKRLKKWIKDHCKGYGNLFPEDEMKRQWKKADKKRK